MRPLALAGLAAVPVAGLALLLARPSLDVHWEHHPAHFWLVVAAGVLTGGLGFLLGEAAARRGDARVLLLSLGFLTAFGFLALHALATPGVLLEGSTRGFEIASPIGLLLAGAFVAASTLPLSPGRARMVVARRRLVFGGLLLLMGAWAFVSLSSLSPLEAPLPPEEAQGPLVSLAIAGALAYGYAAFRYGTVYRRRRSVFVLAVVASFVLLTEAMFAIAFARNWHATWWEWHLLMLAAFALVGRSTWEEWKVEGSTAEIFSAVYEDRTLGSTREVTVLFADMLGFSSYAEHTPEDEVKAMLDEYFQAATPVIRANRGEVDKLMGDAIMAWFTAEGHELDAARAALALQAALGRVSDAHPSWPRFRAGVNTGPAVAGVVEARGGRQFTMLGDAVNVASRLEGQARAGEVVVGEATRAALGPDAVIEDLGEILVKGRERPVRAFLLRELAARGCERDERLDDQEPEAER